MRILFILILSILTYCSSVMGQQKVECKVIYDDNFNPTVVTEIRNNSTSKTITTIEFEIECKRKNAYMFDTMAYDRETKIVKVNIPAQSKREITFPINIPEGFVFYGSSVTRVRWSDGTIKNY